MSRRAGQLSNTDLVLRTLKAARRPLSAYDILERLGASGIASPVTVYRALDRLVAAGSVHRIESLSAYLADVSPGNSGGGPAAFAICDGCGSVEPLHDPDLQARLAADAEARRFTPRRMTVELLGTCGACRERDGEGER